MNQRLFVAINLDNPTKLALAKIIGQLPNSPAINKTRVDNLHLTLQFLGDTQENLIPEIQAILDTVAATYQPLQLSFDQIGAFPNWPMPHTIWIGVDADNLFKLQTELAQRLIELVPTLELKPFTPHLTLARLKSPLANIDQIKSLANPYIPTVFITHIDLMASDLTPQGPIYTVISQHNLA